MKIVSKRLKFLMFSSRADKRFDRFLNELIIKRNQRSTFEEKIVKFFVTIALRIAIRPHHWKDKRKNKEIVIKAYRGIVSKDFVFIPPAFAFYLIMAFMPVITIILLIISLWYPADSFFTKAVGNFIHLDLESASNEFTFNGIASNVVATFIVILTSSWIASAGFAKLVFTESHLYGHEKFGGFWMNRLRGIFIVLALAVYFSLGMFMFSLVPIILNFIGLNENGQTYKVLYYIANTGGGFVFLYTGFVLLFKFSPRFKLTWRQVHPGAVVATVPSLLFTIVFMYISKFLFDYSRFGVIAPIMTLAVILFTLSYFIYVGLITNAAFYNVHHAKYTIAKSTISKK